MYITRDLVSWKTEKRKSAKSLVQNTIVTLNFKTSMIVYFSGNELIVNHFSFSIQFLTPVLSNTVK